MEIVARYLKMFPKSFFPKTFFAGTYFPPIDGGIVVAPAILNPRIIRIRRR